MAELESITTTGDNKAINLGTWPSAPTVSSTSSPKLNSTLKRFNLPTTGRNNKTMNQTKTFPLRVLLTVTTGRLLTEPHDGGNGIDQLYAILDWMTNDQNFTHQLPRVAEECKPWLFKWFPELAPCGVQSALDSFDRWRKADKTGTAQEAIKMWLTELKMMFPTLKDEYDVPRIHPPDHARKDPVKELIEMVEDKSKVITVQI